MKGIYDNLEGGLRPGSFFSAYRLSLAIEKDSNEYGYVFR